MIAETDLFIFSICNGHSWNVKKKKKVPEKEKNKCVSGSRAAAAAAAGRVGFLLRSIFPGSNVLSSGQALSGLGGRLSIPPRSPALNPTAPAENQ